MEEKFIIYFIKKWRVTSLFFDGNPAILELKVITLKILKFVQI